MKKLFGVLIMSAMLLMAGVAFAQGDTTAVDTTVVADNGGGGWLSSLLNIRTISEIILALFGAVILYRFNAVKTALQTVIDAAKDGSVSESEFQDIVDKVKAIWGKKKE